MDANRRESMVDYIKKKYEGKDKDDTYELQMELAIDADSKLRMNTILFDDMEFALKDLDKEPDSQFRRRTFIRTMFAHIEAQLSMMRQYVVIWYRLGAIRLTKDDMRKLADEIQAIWDESLIPEKPIRLKLIDNMKFTFKLFGSTPEKSIVTLDTSSPGWQSFLVSVTIRDNLMHPKIEQNLLISDNEMMRVLSAWGWYTDISSHVLSGQPVRF